MNEIKHLVIEILSLLILAALLVSLVRADIISVNSGGSGNISITPDEYTEGSFGDPGIEQPAAEEVPPEVVVPGGGGGGGGRVTVGNITVSPSQFDITMLINTNIRKTLTVTNSGTTSRTITISQTGLNNMIIIENTSISLNSGQTKQIGVIFVALNQTGIYNGTIYVGTIAIPVTLNVLKEFILFDSNIVVLNDNYQVPQGDVLKTEVTLIPMGGPVRMDVTLNYFIKNLNGTVFLTRSETLLVEEQKRIRRDFDTGGLPLGKYVVELELVYPFGVAPSSAHFDVIENARDIFSLVMYWIMFGIIIILIALITLTIIRTIRKMRGNRVVNSEQGVSEY
ncbi:MAG: hypothetical protein PHH00_02545 [Candidatus Nanoarchaeia archaeon]|nr:hypothetical protein [Candidatus Nanoarchaeia archaeon]